MASVTEENYLKALFNLQDDKGEVSMSDLSGALQVSSPTSNSMIKNLHAQGFVKYEKYKPIKLTKKGAKKAALIVRKHRLTEMFLVEQMGFGWEEVHDVAEQIEHIKSQRFFDRMDELLGSPTLDPHGSPIPDKAGNVVQRELMVLNECKPGMTVRLSALKSTPEELLLYLVGRDIRIGTRLKLLSVESFDNSVHVSYGNRQDEVLSQKVAENLLVQSVS